MGLMHAQDNGPGVSGTEPECTARYRSYYIPVGLNIARTGIEYHRSPKKYTQGITPHPTGGRGVGVPVHPTETPGGLQVESQELVVQHLYGHYKHRSYIGPSVFPILV